MIKACACAAACIASTGILRAGSPGAAQPSAWTFVVPPISLADKSAETQPASAPTTLEDEPANAEAEGVQLPLSFDITYYLLSDYVSRGINYSEYPHENREKPNHQITTALTFDLAGMLGKERGSYGSIHFDTFFEWYAAQKTLNPDGGGQNLQEIDYTIGYSYEFTRIATTARANYTFMRYPNDGFYNSTEVYFEIEHNDAWLWKWMLPENEDGVLNPWVSYAYDWDAAQRGSWLEFGVYHDFQVAPHVTLTPSFTVAADWGYLDGSLDTGREGKSGQIACLQYGLAVGYDITELIGLDKWGYGSVLLSGFLYYNNVPQRIGEQGLAADEFWGGMSIGWSF